MVLAQICHNFCDAVFQSECVTIIMQETCQNGIQEAVPIGLKQNNFKVVLPDISFQISPLLLKNCGMFPASKLKFSEIPPKNWKPLLASWTFVKGCLFTTSDQSRCKHGQDVAVGSSILDNIVQGIRYFVQFCLAFYRHNYVIVTSCSSFVKFLNRYIEKWH